MRKLCVLGTPLLVTNYQELGSKCLEWARGPGAIAIDFANTQIVTMRRHDVAYRDASTAFDHFSPDGMPLIWCLNRAGAKMKDRVYGPAFMRHFLSVVPVEYTHYLLGGSEEMCNRLREVFKGINPGVRFVGSFHGRCSVDGVLEGSSEQEVIAELNRLSPDFIWLSFGCPKQQQWVIRHKAMIKRGVMMTVGFAFDVNAGMKSDAPLWMQRRGLTWIFRLWSEPRRLGPRYLRYNFLFLWYLFIDGLRGRAWGRCPELVPS